MYYRKKYWVYIIHCKDDSLYTGISSWVELRFMRHEAGYYKDCYTYRRRPLILVYAEAFDNPKSAIAWEKRIKKWSRAKKWALIEGNWDKLKELAMCRNYTSHKFYRATINSSEATDSLSEVENSTVANKS